MCKIIMLIILAVFFPIICTFMFGVIFVLCVYNADDIPFSKCCCWLSYMLIDGGDTDPCTVGHAIICCFKIPIQITMGVILGFFISLVAWIPVFIFCMYQIYKKMRISCAL